MQYVFFSALTNILNVPRLPGLRPLSNYEYTCNALGFYTARPFVTQHTQSNGGTFSLWAGLHSDGRFSLFQSREWVELKVLEMTPDLTQLGNSLEEAQLLQKQHDEVLQKLAVSSAESRSHGG